MLLAPARIPRRVGRAFDDLSTIAARAREYPYLLGEALRRVDALLVEAEELTATGAQMLGTGRELAVMTQQVHTTMLAVHEIAGGLGRIGSGLEDRSRELLLSGATLTERSNSLEAQLRELTKGTLRLNDATAQLDADVRSLLSAMPKLIEGVDTVEQLEGAVETVAETMEPLQDTAERVGRVTKRLSRRGS